MMPIQFTVTDSIPERRHKSKYSELAEALKALPAGKSVRVSLDTFKGAPQMHLKNTGVLLDRKLRSAKRADGIYLWLAD